MRKPASSLWKPWPKNEINYNNIDNNSIDNNSINNNNIENNNIVEALP